MVHKYAVLSVTTLGALMAAIDSTIIFLAIPEIGQYFGIGISYLSLIIIIYLVAATAMMIPSISLAARFGKKTLYMTGFALFTVSSLLIVFSPNVLIVVILRAIEGAAAGIMGSLGIPILMDSFESGERGRAVGINAISWSIGTLVGPILGGFLVVIDWRLIFLINVPIGVFA
ncbi:MAG: MFS transporter, partial [Nitrososphaerota archaeon]|nr:MFS transporter [Nitrososphaerota archaeon]